MSTEHAGRRLFAAGTLRGGVTVLALGVDGTWRADPDRAEQVEVMGRKIGPPLSVRDAGVVLDWLQAVGADALRAALDPPASPGDGPDTAPHVRGSDTSKAAARDVAPALRGKREALLRFIMQHRRARGATDNELITAMCGVYGWNASTPRPRRIELTRAGWLEDSGERRNGSAVWRPTDKAWTWWRDQQNGGNHV